MTSKTTETEQTIIIPKKRIQSLLDEFNGVSLCVPLHSPVTPYIENPSKFQEYVCKHNILVEHYKQGVFSIKDTKIYVIFYQGSRIYRVNQRKKNWFRQTESWKDFPFFELARQYFNQII